MRDAGLAVELLETRHVRNASKTRGVGREALGQNHFELRSFIGSDGDVEQTEQGVHDDREEGENPSADPIEPGAEEVAGKSVHCVWLAKMGVAVTAARRSE
jgi:hypothetical protein